jgi:death-on-curing protein
MANWIWVTHEAALSLHLEQLAEHGGGHGVRDEGLFESAMARPENRAAYGEPDAASLAANYAFGIARNHPFIDGNKRTALVVSELFLAKNGLRVDSGDAEMLAIFLDLAAGELTEDELAGWFRERIVAG